MIGRNKHADRVSLFSWGHDLASSVSRLLEQDVKPGCIQSQGKELRSETLRRMVQKLDCAVPVNAAILLAQLKRLVIEIQDHRFRQ